MQALRARLQQSESRAVDSAPYLELEERRRRAEEGKREALRELDLAAEEVSRVRAAKAQLEDRLQVSEHSLAQMSGGGATGTTVDGEYEEWSNDSGGNGDGGGGGGGGAASRREAQPRRSRWVGAHRDERAERPAAAGVPQDQRVARGAGQRHLCAHRQRAHPRALPRFKAHK